ncbi:MAG: aminopeptidase, partial [bacterium]
MPDPRVTKLAQVLVHYSLQLRPNDLVRISGPALAAPLIRAAYAEALAAGANPYVKASVEGVDEFYYRGASDAQLRFLNPMDELEVERVDATLGIWAHWNTRNLTGIEPRKLSLRREAT